MQFTKVGNTELLSSYQGGRSLSTGKWCHSGSKNEMDFERGNETDSGRFKGLGTWFHWIDVRKGNRMSRFFVKRKLTWVFTLNPGIWRNCPGLIKPDTWTQDSRPTLSFFCIPPTARKAEGGTARAVRPVPATRWEKAFLWKPGSHSRNCKHHHYRNAAQIPKDYHVGWFHEHIYLSPMQSPRCIPLTRFEFAEL